MAAVKAYTPGEAYKIAHPFAVRQQVVELAKQGLGSRRIGRLVGINDSTIRAWLRKYRESGLESLRPYWRRETEQKRSVREEKRSRKEERFATAFQAYASSLEPVASIARRYGIDYSAFKYHVKTFHPELVEQRLQLRGYRATEEDGGRAKQGERTNLPMAADKNGR